MTEEMTISSERVFDGRAVRLRVDTVISHRGLKATREIVEHDDCIAVLALDTDEKILLVRQFRKAVEKDLLEIPAGGIDPGESPEDAVSREMQEETGYMPRKIERLGGFYSAPGYATEYLYIYLATDLVPARLFAEDTEGITVVRVSLEEMLKRAASGEIQDSKTLAGLLLFLEYRKNLPA